MSHTPECSLMLSLYSHPLSPALSPGGRRSVPITVVCCLVVLPMECTPSKLWRLAAFTHHHLRSFEMHASWVHRGFGALSAEEHSRVRRGHR